MRAIRNRGETVSTWAPSFVKATTHHSHDQIIKFNQGYELTKTVYNILYVSQIGLDVKSTKCSRLHCRNKCGDTRDIGDWIRPRRPMSEPELQKPDAGGDNDGIAENRLSENWTVFGVRLAWDALEAIG